MRFRAAFAIHGLGVAAGDILPCGLPRVRGDLRRVLAVAGFGPDQLEIRVPGDQLFINGEGLGTAVPSGFSIAARPFRLAPGPDVAGAELDRGLLTVVPDLRSAERPVRTVAIGPRNP